MVLLTIVSFYGYFVSDSGDKLSYVISDDEHFLKSSEKFFD